MMRFPRFLNALEAHIVSGGLADDEESPAIMRGRVREPLSRPESSARPRARATGQPRPVRRSMTLEQAQATQFADEQFQREMADGG